MECSSFLSSYSLLIGAIVTGLVPTISSSMPEKDRFTIVENTEIES
jgi:hypothetical protein